MFIGRQSIQLDDKNRLRIPAKYRSQLGERFYLMYGPGKYLYVLSEERFYELTASLNGVRLSDISGQASSVIVFSSAEQPTEDGQGRFVLPQHCKNYAGIDKKVIFKGGGAYLTLWADDTSEENADAPVASVDEVTASFRELEKYDL